MATSDFRYLHPDPTIKYYSMHGYICKLSHIWSSKASSSKQAIYIYDHVFFASYIYDHVNVELKLDQDKIEGKSRRRGGKVPLDLLTRKDT
jgi:hypothetical protein